MTTVVRTAAEIALLVLIWRMDVWPTALLLTLFWLRYVLETVADWRASARLQETRARIHALREGRAYNSVEPETRRPTQTR